MQEAGRLGITGTPAFAVNGILLFGLQTAEAFDEIIRSELGLPERTDEIAVEIVTRTRGRDDRWLLQPACK